MTVNSSSLQLDLIVAGGAVELSGIILGAWEIWSTRKATAGFINRSRTVYLSGSARLGPITTGGTGTVSGPQLVPTIDDRVRALESCLPALEGKVKALPGDLEQRWRSDLESVTSTREHADRDLIKALDTFTRELHAGAWRRYLAVGLLIAGTICLTAAGLASTL